VAIDVTEAGDRVRLIQIRIKDGNLWSTSQLCDQLGQSRGTPVRFRDPERFHWDANTRDTVTLLADLLQAGAAQGVIHADFTAELIERAETVLGHQLYDLLFRGTAGNDLRDALGEWERSELDLVRIELEFDGGDKNVLASLPWEFVRLPEDDGGDFLIRKSVLVLNRRLALSDSSQLRKLLTEDPVKVLIVVASPGRAKDGEEQLPQVHGESLAERLGELSARSKGRLQFEVLEDTPLGGGDGDVVVNRQALDAALSAHAPHVIHFLGHGRRKEKRGQLALTDEDGTPAWINDQDFASLVTANNNLRLVFLQACESALPSQYMTGASGVAAQIASRRIPAVVAMQYSVQAAAADVFADAFYAALVGEKPVPVDVAVHRARRQMSLAASDETRSSLPLPVVYLFDYNRLMGSGEDLSDGSRESGGPAPPAVIQAATFPCPRCDTAVANTATRCGECALAFVCYKCGQRWEPLKTYCTQCPADQVTYVRQPPWERRSRQESPSDSGFTVGVG
jgi:hypothetical protein